MEPFLAKKARKYQAYNNLCFTAILNVLLDHFHILCAELPELAYK